MRRKQKSEARSQKLKSEIIRSQKLKPSQKLGIIGGQYKGYRLQGFSHSHIRPMTERVRESLFNMIGPELSGTSALDLFCGTGSIGLEALSRGAQKLVFVDKSRDSINLLKKNLHQLNLLPSTPSIDIKIWQKDSFKFLSSYKEKPFDFIFADPPFKQKLCHLLLESFSRSPACGPKTLLILEGQKGEKVLNIYHSLKLKEERSFGDKKLLFFHQK